jgi:Glycosyltransferase
MYFETAGTVGGNIMNIVINAVLAHEQPRGVGRYINNLLPAMASIDKNNQYYIYYGKWMSNYDFLNIRQDNFHFIELDIRNSQIIRNIYLALFLPIKCLKYHPNIFFLIDTQAILFKPCKVLSTIHDLAEFVVPEKYSKKQALLRRAIVTVQVKLSNRILTVSEYSKNDICKRFHTPENKVHVTYNAVRSNGTEKMAQPEKYFLFVSETEKTKNLMALIKAFALLPAEVREEYSIYVVGKKGNDYENIKNEIAKKEFTSKVKFWGYLSDKELADLYAKAYAFVFPSFFEGFGLPVLEAMERGTPVLCSNTSSIPEVGGDAVLTFDPYNPHDLANQMCKLIDNCKLRKEMILKGIARAKLFTPERCALDTLAVISAMQK